MMRAAEQGQRKNPFKTEISIKTLLLCKIQRAQKKSMGFTEILLLCRGWTFEKSLAHCNG